MYELPVRGPDRTRREYHAENAAVRMPGLAPARFHHDTRKCTGFVGALACWNAMEELFEFLFGASGRINRAKYWRSLLIFCSAGLLVGVILLTAAGLAAPLFILMLAIVFIPWLLWGIAFHTERLHDRGKARGGCWCSMPCRECWTSWRKVLVCRSRWNGAALRPGAGRRCALDLGIC